MKKDCDKKAVRKDWIERVVVRLTMQRVMDEEKINRLIDAILVMQEQEDIPPLRFAHSLRKPSPPLETF